MRGFHQLFVAIFGPAVLRPRIVRRWRRRMIPWYAAIWRSFLAGFHAGYKG